MKDGNFIGRIEPSSRTCYKIECVECKVRISDDDPAYVYFDDQRLELCIMCEICHTSPVIK